MSMERPRRPNSSACVVDKDCDAGCATAVVPIATTEALDADRWDVDREGSLPGAAIESTEEAVSSSTGAPTLGSSHPATVSAP